MTAENLPRFDIAALKRLAGGAFVRILMREKLFDRAWAMTRRHRVSAAVIEHLARESEADHPRGSGRLRAARRRARQRGSNHAYEEAAGFVARMGRLRPAAELAGYVANLRERFAPRRNFMKLLG
jgi:hypothetical protein